MANHPDHPAPGEQTDPAARPGESHNVTIPDGDTRHAYPEDDQGVVTQNRASAVPHDHEDARDSAESMTIRRTSTDRDGIAAVPRFTHATEQRRDHSAGDTRETVFDPAQDNAGPQSDKG